MAKKPTDTTSTQPDTVAEFGGKRVYFEAKRPNGDELEFGLPTGRLDVVFTVKGPIELRPPQTATRSTYQVVEKQQPHMRDLLRDVELGAKKTYGRIIRRSRPDRRAE